MSNANADSCMFELLSRTALIQAAVDLLSICRLVHLVIMETAVRHSVSHQCIAMLCVFLNTGEEVECEKWTIKFKLLCRAVLSQAVVDLPSLC